MLSIETEGTVPVPPQVGHRPRAVWGEKSPGSSFFREKSQSGQLKLVENAVSSRVL